MLTMVLVSPCAPEHSAMSGTVQNNGTKSLEDEQGSSHRPTRKLSLLVDYSKKKADIAATSSATAGASIAQRARLFGSLGHESAGTTDAIIDRALATLTGAQDSSEQDKDNIHDDNAAPISFRLRRSSMERCKSFDERKLTTYETLQNSLRNLMLEEDQEGSDHQQSESSSSNDDPMMSCSMPTTTLPSPGGNRRLQLARIKHRNQNHQSMRQLTTSSGSTRQLMKSLGGDSDLGNGSENVTTVSPVKSPTRRPTLRGEKGSLRSPSSRNLIRRSRTMPNKPGMPNVMKNSLSNGTYHGQSTSFRLAKPKDSLSSASEHSYLKHPVSVSKASKLSARRTSLMAMSESMPATNGTSCRRATLRSHSTGSRRELLADCSVSNNHDSFTNLEVDASHFVTGSRIRRHGSIPKLIVAD